MISLKEYLVKYNNHDAHTDSCTIKDAIDKIQARLDDGHLKESDKSGVHDKDKKEITIGKLLSDLTLVADYIGEDEVLSSLTLDIDELEKFMNEN